MDEGDPTDADLPGATLRMWHAYEGQAPIARDPGAPPALDLPPSDGPPPGVKHPLHHELLVKELRWFAHVPWELCQRAWQSFAGSLHQLIRAALGHACARIYTSLDGDIERIVVGLTAARLRLHGHAEKRDFVVFGVDPNSIELIAWFLREHVDGAEPTASRIVQWALAGFADDPTLERDTPLIPESDAPRPERARWAPAPMPRDAVPRDELRSFLAGVAAKL